MRKLIQLIRRFWNLILFIILEVVSFVLIAKRQRVQGVDIVNSSNAIVGFFYKKQNDVVYYFQLKQMNDSLLNENTRLRNSIAQSSNVDTFRDSIVRIAMPLRDTVKSAVSDTSKKGIGPVKTIRYASYRYIPARVINNSIANDRMNYITLNRGEDDGIRKNMAVVTGNGIVGRVANVSAHYATVVSVLSEGRSYSACLGDGTEGFITWEKGSPDYVTLTKIPLQQKVKRGDSVFTTGYSIFPENIMVGNIAKIDTIRTNNTKNLRVKLSTNFRRLQYVYVVENKLGEEKRKLESQNIQTKE